MNIEYTVQIWEEGGEFIAHAMPLDVMSAGRTPDHARKALYEAVDLFLATAAEMGTVQEILKETGHEFKQGSWVSPFWVSIERHIAPVGV